MALLRRDGGPRRVELGTLYGRRYGRRVARAFSHQRSARARSFQPSPAVARAVSGQCLDWAVAREGMRPAC